VIEDIKILETVERYITGQMGPEERMHFEQLRKSNPEIDQAVVEHTFFLQQINRYDSTRKLKAELNDAHLYLAEKGLIRSPRLKGKAKVVYMYNRYKKVAAIAASIAGLTVLTMSALIWYISPVIPREGKDIDVLKRDIHNIGQTVNQSKQKIQELDATIKNVKAQTVPEPRDYKSGGTGFLLDAKGYIITNAHVVENANHVAVQGSNGTDLNASIVFTDKLHDLAVLKIDDKNFKSPSSIPYSIKRSGGDVAESIYTLGYPRNDIVYGEGYLAAKTGFNGDSAAFQITIPANMGNSGSPVLNHNGEVIGIISSKQRSAEGAVFAIKSKYIYYVLNDLQKDSTMPSIKLPLTSSLKGIDRTQQFKKMLDFVYMVKVD
jgi:serine protease Do